MTVERGRTPSPTREEARDEVVDRRSEDRRGPQHGDDRVRQLLGEARDLGLGLELVGEEGLARRSAQRMALGEEVRVRRMRAVEHRLRPHDDLTHARMPRSDEDVTCADALELVRERGRM